MGSPALKPSSDSVRDYERIDAARSELYAAWSEEFGRWKAGDWQPHFTLGSLPTAVQPSSIAAPLGTLSAEIESELRGVAIEFSDANLYAFSGMTRFYRV